MGMSRVEPDRRLLVRDFAAFGDDYFHPFTSGLHVHNLVSAQIIHLVDPNRNTTVIESYKFGAYAKFKRSVAQRGAR